MSLVSVFMQEIGMIQDDKIRGFLVDALGDTPEFLADNSRFVDRTAKTFKIVRNMIQTLDGLDEVYDILGVASLIQDLDQFDDDGNENFSHPVTLRTRLFKYSEQIGLDRFDDIMRMVESSHGHNSPIPQVAPKLNDTVYMWVLPLANELAKMTA